MLKRSSGRLTRESRLADQVTNALRRSIHYRRDHHPTVTLADQNHIMQLFILQHGQYILNMRLQVNLRIRQMSTFAQPGQRRGKHLSAPLTQVPG